METPPGILIDHETFIRKAYNEAINKRNFDRAEELEMFYSLNYVD